MSLIDHDEAIKILREEGVVALPTETVYGLAGRISSEKALKLIFSTKKRPYFDPLIVHVRDVAQARSLTKSWPKAAEVLSRAFWPGPLTLVLPKNELVSDLITSGLSSVGVRCPQHPSASRILQQLGEPFAAPSANLFGRTSPTTAQHVIEEFAGQVPVVDGGPCPVGIESTVISVDDNQLSLLRPGNITQEQISTTLKNSGLEFQWVTAQRSDAPGQMKHHYMPTKPLFSVYETFRGDLLAHLNQKIRELPDSVEGVKIVKPDKIKSVVELKLSDNSIEAARELYARLRKLSTEPQDAIVFYVRSTHLSSDWVAIIERLSKASSAKII